MLLCLSLRFPDAGRRDVNTKVTARRNEISRRHTSVILYKRKNKQTNKQTNTRDQSLKRSMEKNRTSMTETDIPATETRTPTARKSALVAMMRKVFRVNPFLELFPLKPCFNEMMTKTPFVTREPAIHANRGTKA